jgi:hypothetical protein
MFSFTKESRESIFVVFDNSKVIPSHSMFLHKPEDVDPPLSSAGKRFQESKESRAIYIRSV